MRTLEIYSYPNKIHQRKHGPQGYIDYSTYKDWLRDEFTFRCVYCLYREKWHQEGEKLFTVEHLNPKVENPEDEFNYENLFYCCHQCNSNKNTKSFDYDPCRYNYAEHLKINDNGTITPLTPYGKYIIGVFILDDPLRTDFRRRWISILSKTNSNEWLEFPVNLPDLVSKKPTLNTRPDGLNTCYFELRKKGQLPKTY